MLLYRGIDYLSSQRTQSLEGSSVIQSDQATVANHVGIHNGDQPAPIWRIPSKVRCVAPRHSEWPHDRIDAVSRGTNETKRLQSTAPRKLAAPAL